jgi:aminoglycoside phosphotransferase (APT) family kinase protein
MEMRRGDISTLGAAAMTMHDDQLHVDADIVRAMVAEQFPELRALPVAQLATAGTVNAIFRIGDELAARFPLQPDSVERAREALEIEARAAGEFAGHSPFPAPRIMGLGRPGSRYPMPWTLQSWIEGEPATPGGLAASVPFAEDIGMLIVALRRADTLDRVFDGKGRGGDLKLHDDWMATCLTRSEGLLDVPRLRRTWAALRELPAGSADVMSHKDLIPANLLVREERLAGVLDAGGFGPADPALDLVAAWHLFDPDRRQFIRDRVESDEIEWQRGAAWAFVQAMGLVWYYRISNPSMAALGRSTLDRLLGDPILAEF